MVDQFVSKIIQTEQSSGVFVVFSNYTAVRQYRRYLLGFTVLSSEDVPVFSKDGLHGRNRVAMHLFFDLVYRANLSE